MPRTFVAAPTLGIRYCGVPPEMHMPMLHNGFWVAGTEGMEKMETTIVCYIGTTIKIHSFIPD